MVRSFLLGICSLLFLTMSQCTSTKELSSPNFIGEGSYYRTWVAGVEGGGSGLDFFIDIKDIPESVVLEEVYFKKYNTSIVYNSGAYVARFKTTLNSTSDESSINNTSTIVKSPFEIEEEEAILVYKENGKVKYVKISQIENKGHMALPSAGGREIRN